MGGRRRQCGETETEVEVEAETIESLAVCSSQRTREHERERERNAIRLSQQVYYEYVPKSSFFLACRPSLVTLEAPSFPAAAFPAAFAAFAAFLASFAAFRAASSSSLEAASVISLTWSAMLTGRLTPARTERDAQIDGRPAVGDDDQSNLENEEEDDQSPIALSRTSPWRWPPPDLPDQVLVFRRSYSEF